MSAQAVRENGYAEEGKNEVSMTLNMLRYFISVAEKGSFTEAAAACYVSQPALSRAIANLEKEIGCTLIDRDIRKSVRLTPAGEVMLVEARRILLQLDVMAERVRTAERESCVSISVGYIAYGMLRRFRAAKEEALSALTRGGARLLPVYGSAPEIKERVLSGELDCAILPESATWDMDCRKAAVCSLAMRVLIPRTHPLFGVKSVRIEQLRDSGFVFFDPRDLPMTLAGNMKLCHEAGFAPKIVGYGRKIGDVSDLAYQQGALGLVSEAFDYAATEDIALVPVEGDRLVYGLSLVARRQGVNPMTERLFADIEQSL